MEGLEGRQQPLFFLPFFQEGDGGRLPFAYKDTPLGMVNGIARMDADACAQSGGIN